MKIKSKVIGLVVFCIPACLIAGEAAQPEAESIVSETLQAQARDMMAEIYAGMKTERRLPPDISAGELKKRTDTNMEWLNKLKIFTVSAAQEAIFKKGKFEDKKNLEELGKLIPILKSGAPDLPIQTVYAMRHYEAKDLKGARLELCLRIVSYSVDTLRAIGGEGKPPAK